MREEASASISPVIKLPKENIHHCGTQGPVDSLISFYLESYRTPVQIYNLPQAQTCQHHSSGTYWREDKPQGSESGYSDRKHERINYKFSVTETYMLRLNATAAVRCLRHTLTHSLVNSESM